MAFSILKGINAYVFFRQLRTATARKAHDRSPTSDREVTAWSSSADMNTPSATEPPCLSLYPYAGKVKRCGTDKCPCINERIIAEQQRAERSRCRNDGGDPVSTLCKTTESISERKRGNPHVLQKWRSTALLSPSGCQVG